MSATCTRTEPRYTLELTETQAEHLTALLGCLNSWETPLAEVFEALDNEVTNRTVTFSDLFEWNAATEELVYK